MPVRETSSTRCGKQAWVLRAGALPGASFDWSGWSFSQSPAGEHLWAYKKTERERDLKKVPALKKQKQGGVHPLTRTIVLHLSGYPWSCPQSFCQSHLQSIVSAPLPYVGHIFLQAEKQNRAEMIAQTWYEFRFFLVLLIQNSKTLNN